MAPPLRSVRRPGKANPHEAAPAMQHVLVVQPDAALSSLAVTAATLLLFTVPSTGLWFSVLPAAAHALLGADGRRP